MIISMAILFLKFEEIATVVCLLASNQVYSTISYRFFKFKNFIIMKLSEMMFSMSAFFNCAFLN